MKTYGVLIADHSAVMRKKLTGLIESDERFKVIGRARNGQDLIDKSSKLKPNLIIANMSLPEFLGVNVLPTILAERYVANLVFSERSIDEEQALINGAHHFIDINTLLQKTPEGLAQFIATLIDNIESPFNCTYRELAEYKEEPSLEIEQHFKGGEGLLVIGSSTGGPSALQVVLSQLPKEFPVPIVIIQHIPVGFTKALSDRFDKVCALHVKEAEHNEKLINGTVYIAPAGFHTTIDSKDEQYHFNLNASIEGHYMYKPSIDVTLYSVGRYLSNKLQVVILTGMGDDGLKGCKLVHAKGATIYAEAKETCVVYGMPKVIAQANLADKIVPIHEMGQEIINRYLL